MLRALGGALLILAGALAGFERLSVQRRRLACLRSLADALGRLAVEIETLQSPLEEALSHLTDCPLTEGVYQSFGTAPFEALWTRAADAQPISAEERRAVAALGGVLGRCSAERQTAELSLARRRLTDMADALEREIAARSRRFPLLGAALGAIAAVMLF